MNLSVPPTSPFLNLYTVAPPCPTYLETLARCLRLLRLAPQHRLLLGVERLQPLQLRGVGPALLAQLQQLLVALPHALGVVLSAPLRLLGQVDLQRGTLEGILDVVCGEAVEGGPE